MLTAEIILAISKHDTLNPLSIKFRPFVNSVCDTKYHKWCSSTNMVICEPEQMSESLIEVIVCSFNTNLSEGVSKHSLGHCQVI
jgi:hypothetical protein